VVFQATPSDRISAAVEYLHTRYDDFAFTVYNAAQPGGAGTLNFYDPLATSCRLGTPVDYPLTPNIPGFYRDSLQPLDCSGEPLIKAAEWSGSAAYEHRFNLPNSAGLMVGADLTFSSSYFLTPDFIRTGEDDGYTRTNAHVTYVSSSGKWSVTGWIRNIGNEDVYTGGFRYPFSSHPAQGGDPSLYYTQIREPRTYGLRARVEF
jgi:iron complex outermembrane receptor protein